MVEKQVRRDPTPEVGRKAATKILQNASEKVKKAAANGACRAPVTSLQICGLLRIQILILTFVLDTEKD